MEGAAAFAFAPLTPKSMEEFIAGLPAKERATFAWAPRKLSVELERVLNAPALDLEMLRSVSRTIFSDLVALGPPILGLLEKARGSAYERLLANLQAKVDLMAAQLPVRTRRPAIRAFMTWMFLGVAAIRTIDPQVAWEKIATVQQQPEDLTFKSDLAIGFILSMAILHAVEQGRAREPLIHEMALVADREARREVESLVEAHPSEPKARLPWYYEDSEHAARYRSYALWAEAETSANDRAVELLEEWSAEPADPEEAARWAEIRRALDEDRLSSRSLFP